MSPPLLAILGPTGSGKSALALALADRVGGEIVSVDSAQVFIGLDIGTAKPTAEERARAPHHLIDVIDSETQWTAAHFQAAADAAIRDIEARGRRPILCGGTGLWYRALVHGVFEAPAIDPEVRARVREELATRGPAALHAELARVDPASAVKLHPNDPQRIGRALEVQRQTGRPISDFQAEHGFRERRHAVRAVALAWPREALWARLRARTEAMYRAGLVEETRALLARGARPDGPGLSIIGYRDAVAVAEGRLDEAAALEATYLATRQYAKRQRNWWNGEPTVSWIDAAEDEASLLERVLSADGAG